MTSTFSKFCRSVVVVKRFCNAGYRWDAIPREELQKESDYAGPFKSPTMAGGLFAINK
jgi:hypothetical protein